jgi:hypothetical protein
LFSSEGVGREAVVVKISQEKNIMKEIQNNAISSA